MTAQDDKENIHTKAIDYPRAGGKHPKAPVVGDREGEQTRKGGK